MTELFAIVSFHPESALFHPGCVNLRVFLCGVPVYASAQTLDFLAMAKNAFFPNWKLLVSHPGFPDGNQLVAKVDDHVGFIAADFAGPGFFLFFPGFAG